jgi:hypothetical protein
MTFEHKDIEPKAFVTFESGITQRPFDQDAGHTVSAPRSVDGGINGIPDPRVLSRELLGQNDDSNVGSVQAERIEPDIALADVIERPKTGLRKVFEDIIFGKPAPPPMPANVKGMQRLNSITEQTKKRTGF